jgi:hypothetical protein
VLILVGLKMLLERAEADFPRFHEAVHFPMPTAAMLGVIGGILLVSVAASMVFPARKES